MSRHRMEAPRPRTLWPAAGFSARRVPVRAARQRGRPGHAKPAVAPEWRQRLTRAQRRMLIRTGNRLLVSPWFAAGAGFVIAMGALIYMPHANVDFGGAIHVTHCKLANCPQLTPQGGVPGLPAGMDGGRVSASPSTSAAPVMTVWYQPLADSTPSGFAMWIVFSPPPGLSRWQLRFVIPGATSVYVYGAPHWQPYGVDGVTVSSFVAGTESAGYAAISGYQDGGISGPSPTGGTVFFQVLGTGMRSAPANCAFTGGACQFKPGHGLVPTAPPSPA